jgi:lysozyme family protein
METLEKLEGGYSNNALDPGGETYRGISRVYFPDWAGWPIIATEPDLTVTPVQRHLDQLTLKFYREQFWNRFQGDKVADLSQSIANQLLECSVNLGVRQCVKHLQKAVNLLNRNQKLYPDMVEDGKLGSITLSYLTKYLQSRPPAFDVAEKRLLNIMNALQGCHYIGIMERYPQREEFRGWFDRV